MTNDNEHYAQSYEHMTSNNYKNDYKLPSGYKKDTTNDCFSNKYKTFMTEISKWYKKEYPEIQKFFKKAHPSIYKNCNKKLFPQGFFKLHIREKSKIKREFNKIWNNYCNGKINNLSNEIKEVFKRHKKFFGIA